MNTAADVPEDSVLSDTSIGDASKSVITTVCGLYVLMQGSPDSNVQCEMASAKMALC